MKTQTKTLEFKKNALVELSNSQLQEVTGGWYTIATIITFSSDTLCSKD
ncbi:hypothetical protein [Pontimicrobium sp. MEBiC01747]